MRVRVLIIICLLWIAGVFIYFNTTADGRADAYNYDNDCVPLSNGRYIVTGSGSLSQYMFDIDKYYRISRIYCISDFCDDGTLEQIEYQQGNIYLLVKAEASVGPKTIPIHNIVKLDENMNRVGSSGWFDLSQEGEIADVTFDDGVLAITQIGKNGTDVYVYPMPEDYLTYEADTDENNVRHVYTLNYTDFFESEVGGTIYFASYEDGVLKKYENVTDEVPEEFYNVYAADAYNNKSLTYAQLLYINYDLFINCIAVMIIGIATILALYVMLVRRNRVAYLILTWEILVLCNSIALIWINGRRVGVFVLAGIIFAAGSFVGVSVLLIQSADLALFIGAMSKLSQGRSDIFKPKTVGGDMNALWNSMFDLMRTIKNARYTFFREYESYYSYAPKMIESYFDKDSLVDVAPGDVKKLNTTVAMIGAESNYTKEEGNEVFAAIADLQENKGGSILCANADITRVEVIFAQDNHDTAEFAMGLKNIITKSDTCVLFHHTDIDYEICGDNRQNMVIARNDELKALFADIDKLTSLRLNFVMTEDAYLNEKEKPLARCIGHFSLSNVNKDIKLYEVLDCLSEKERRNKVDNMQTFAEAMEHMNNKDFYFARNMFAKILLTDPTDEVSRHYLFKCEKSISIDSDTKEDFGLNK